MQGSVQRRLKAWLLTCREHFYMLILSFGTLTMFDRHDIITLYYNKDITVRVFTPNCSVQDVRMLRDPNSYCKNRFIIHLLQHVEQ